MTLDTAKELFKRAGLDYERRRRPRTSPASRRCAMTGETLSVDAHSAIDAPARRAMSSASITGHKHPGDVFLYSAHWDHLGRKDETPGPDKIFNGAIDNGMGSPMVLELAETFAHEKRPQRSVALPVLDAGGAGPARLGIFRRTSAMAA